MVSWKCHFLHFPKAVTMQMLHCIYFHFLIIEKWSIFLLYFFRVRFLAFFSATISALLYLRQNICRSYDTLLQTSSCLPWRIENSKRRKTSFYPPILRTQRTLFFGFLLLNGILLLVVFAVRNTNSMFLRRQKFVPASPLWKQARLTWNFNTVHGMVPFSHSDISLEI